MHEKCEICDKEFKSIIGLTNHIRGSAHGWEIKDYYNKYKKKPGEGVCQNPNCPYGHPETSFQSITKGYSKGCCTSCSQMALGVRDKIKQTLNTKYGGHHLKHNQASIDKKNNTVLERYGAYNVQQNKEVNKKAIANRDEVKKQQTLESTMMERYNVKNPMQIISVRNDFKFHSDRKEVTCYYEKHEGCSKEKRKVSIHNPSYIVCNTCKSLGRENPDKRFSEETNKKREQTLLDNHGVTNARHIPGAWEKIKETSQERYGGVGRASLILDKKFIDTMTRLYGVDNPMHVPDMLEAMKNSSRESVDHALEKRKKYFQDLTGDIDIICALQLDEVREKSRQTMLAKYGVDHHMKLQKNKDKYSKRNRMKFFKRILESDRLKDQYLPLFTFDEYQGVKNNVYPWKCLKCQFEFIDNIDDGSLPRCPQCYPINSSESFMEKEMLLYCESLTSNIISNDRTILDGKEIDILVPDLKLGIEFNGLYWHSEIAGKKDSKYHQLKTLNSINKGYILIQFFEDEWVYKQDIVKSIITNKLGLTTNTYNARDLKVLTVDTSEAMKFLDDNHIQGQYGGLEKLGLYSNGVLLQLIVMGKPRFSKKHDWEILRLSSKLYTRIRGGSSRLIKNFIKMHPNESIITYADARFGYAGFYDYCGFNHVMLSEPNYHYLSNGRRLSRMNFQKHLLESELDIFDDNLTEWENMQLNGYDRIWDCGNYVYELA